LTKIYLLDLKLLNPKRPTNDRRSTVDSQLYELFHQQQLEHQEWLESEEGIAYINGKLIDAAYEDQYEIDVEV